MVCVEGGKEEEEENAEEKEEKGKIGECIKGEGVSLKGRV